MAGHALVTGILNMVGGRWLDLPLRVVAQQTILPAVQLMLDLWRQAHQERC